MLEIHVANNIILFFTTLSLKNVATSSANEEKIKQYMKKPNKNKPTNFHNVPKLIANNKELMIELHCLFVKEGLLLEAFKKPSNLVSDMIWTIK
jgi:hypothetical protein